MKQKGLSVFRQFCVCATAASLLLACDLGDMKPGGGMNLSFARQALDSPCPETWVADANPPTLSRLDIRLLTSTGELHFKKSIELSGGDNVIIDGIDPAYDLTLEVVGVESGTPTWRGASQHINITEGRNAFADVFLTTMEDMSCSMRPLHQARSFTTAAPLGDGRILIVGGVSALSADGCGPGCTQGQATAAVDVFDPGTGTIYPVAALHDPRALATATPLPDGSVLVVGGASRVQLDPAGELPVDVDPVDLVPSFEVYLPAEDLWIRKPLPEGEGRVFHSATALDDGKVLVAGGGVGGTEALDTAIIFDPTNESVGDFVDAGTLMNTPRLGHAAVRNEDGMILLIGGAIRPTAQAVEEYDPVADVFNNRAVSGLNYFFCSAANVPLQPNNILVSGGMRFDGTNLLPPESSNIHEYNSQDDSQTELESGMGSPRWMHKAEVIVGQGILLAGGFTDFQAQATDNLELFVSSDGRLHSAGPERLSTPRAGNASLVLGGARVLLVGGTDGSSLLGSGEIYTAQTAE